MRPLTISALAPTRPSAATRVGAPPQQRQRHRDQAGAQHRRAARARSRPCWQAAAPTMASVGRPMRRSRAGDAPRSRGRPARRSAGAAAPSVKLARLGGSISAIASGRRAAARRNRSSSVARAADARSAAGRLVEDHRGSRSLPHCGCAPPGFRQIADAARSPPDAAIVVQRATHCSGRWNSGTT